MTTRWTLRCGIALILTGFIASCGGRVMDSEGDPYSTFGGASQAGSGGSKASGTGGNAGGSPGVGTGAVPVKGGGAGSVGIGGKSGGAGTTGISGKGGSAGFVGIGGKGGSAGFVGVGGKGGGAGTLATGGKAGSGAAPSAGGVPIDPCAGVRCKDPMCPNGVPSYVPAGACCPVCGPLCTVDCGAPQCGPDEIAVKEPGLCCPICVPAPDAGALCDQTGYSLLRSELEQKYSVVTCSSDSECVIVAVNLCGKPDCGVALGVGYFGSFESNLMSYASANCMGCGPAQISCPTTTPTARCVSGHCAVVRQ